ncbi:MAG: glycosyltransferase [Candidatus Omnitrophota bacterium]|jgi:glycosyltransferase involved in cell wall biosynthesis
MKILFIAEPLTSHTQKWLRFLGEAGHQIYVLSYHNRYANTIKNVSEIAHFEPVNKNPFVFLKYLLELKKIIKRIKPDALTCHYALGTPGLLAALSGFHPQMITILGGIDIYGHRSTNWLRYLIHNKLMAKFIFKTSDMIIVGCKDHKQHLLENGIPGKKIVVIMGDIGLGVDLKMFNNRYDTAQIKRDLDLTGKFVVFCPRRLVTYTNVDLLVKSVPLLKDKIPNIVLMLHTYVADTRYLNYIKELARKIGIENNVIFTGERAYEEMPLLYCASDCTVSISSFDGTPSSIAESMACRVPVIAYDIPSIREWVKDGESGILIKKLDPEEIFKAILKIHSDKKGTEKIVENAARFVENDLDIEKCKKALLDLFRNIKA